jgi:hypothetical protein
MRKDRENPGQPSCNRCGGMHFGSARCPYLDQAQCNNCGGVIAAEEGSDYQVHPNRKFDSLGFAYHPGCELKEKITMQPHQERVVAEMKELDEKIVKLDTFRHSPIYDTLPDAERDRLTRQYAHMKDYSNVLAERIAAF